MKRLSLWLLFFAVLGIQSALAQTYKVKGNVVSKSDNEPLIGVSILQKGTTNGVVTDIDGNYELQIQGGEATLVFSYIGLQTESKRTNRCAECRHGRRLTPDGRRGSRGVRCS